MKQQIFPAIKLTGLCIVLFAVIYPAIIWGFAQLFPSKGKGDLIQSGNKTYYTNIGQSFSQDKYFWSRPSAVAYNSAGSGGSNKGPSNKEYLKDVEKRLDTLLMKNPSLKRAEVPVDLITASGSGLDPDISLQGAKIQVKRIALARRIREDQIMDLIASQTEKPLLGLFGPEKINVLKLNLALDEFK
ncbi:MAG TPA: K(+)-transporting ATPase subunit C [Chryseobacterium sp.]